MVITCDISSSQVGLTKTLSTHFEICIDQNHVITNSLASGTASQQ
jgi:hypothetical protein